MKHIHLFLGLGIGYGRFYKKNVLTFFSLGYNHSNFKNINNTRHRYELADTPQKRSELISALKAEKQICFDTETTGLDANNCELVGFSFCRIPSKPSCSSANQRGNDILTSCHTRKHAIVTGKQIGRASCRERV